MMKKLTWKIAFPNEIKLTCVIIIKIYIKFKLKNIKYYKIFIIFINFKINKKKKKNK